jgi:hypothetical protein
MCINQQSYSKVRILRRVGFSAAEIRCRVAS